MASHIERGDSLFIPFRNGRSISDSQCRPRMYKSLQNFDKAFPKHNHGEKNIEVVEYAEVKHGEWIYHECVSSYDGAISGYSCSQCCYFVDEEIFDRCEYTTEYCGHCGAKMDGERKEQ